MSYVVSFFYPHKNNSLLYFFYNKSFFFLFFPHKKVQNINDDFVRAHFIFMMIFFVHHFCDLKILSAFLILSYGSFQ